MSADSNAILNMSTVNELRAMLDEGYDELIDDYLVDAPTLIQDLSEAVDAGDKTQIIRLSHTLKGSSGNLGVQNIFLLARQLELLGLGQAEGDPRQLLQAIEQAFKEAKSALKGLHGRQV